MFNQSSNSVPSAFASVASPSVPSNMFNQSLNSVPSAFASVASPSLPSAFIPNQSLNSVPSAFIPNQSSNSVPSAFSSVASPSLFDLPSSFTSVASPAPNIYIPVYNAPSIPVDFMTNISSTLTFAYQSKMTALKLDPSNNYFGYILDNIPENQLPIIDDKYSPGYVPDNTKIEDPSLIQENSFKQINDSTNLLYNTFEQQRMANGINDFDLANLGSDVERDRMGKLVPFSNPNKQAVRPPSSSLKLGSFISGSGGRVKLQDHQIDVARRIIFGYNYVPGFLNTGRLGSGKTFLGLWLAQYYNAPLIVIGPTGLRSTWVNNAKRYGITLLDYISYASLRSVNGKQPGHGLLHRSDEKKSYYSSKKGKDIEEDLITFTPTKKLKDLIENGALFIFDEIQNAKNITAQFYACGTIGRAIHQFGGKSRYLLLSGSPLDKVEHIYTLLYFMNIIDNVNLREKGKYTVDVDQIIAKARQVDNNATEQALADKTSFTEYDNQRDQEIVYKVFLYVYKPRFINGMNLQIVGVPYDVRNGFYFISKDFYNNWRQAIRDLESIAGMNVNGVTTINIREYTLVAQKIELNIAYDIALRAYYHLMLNDKCKLIIYMNYLEAINIVQNLLINFNALALNGSISKIEERDKIVDYFNDPHSNVRVLVANTIVGGVGLSLHDTATNVEDQRPRIMYIAPNYNIQGVYQATGRIIRQGMTSPSIVRIFYGHTIYQKYDNKNAETLPEMKIYNALARKSKITYMMLDSHSLAGLKMPANYDFVMEGIDNGATP
jgi:hypothetical protein